MKILVLFPLFLFVNGVFAVEMDVVEPVSMIVGDSFTLHTNLSQIQPGDVIEWRFRQRLTARIITVGSKDLEILVDYENSEKDRLELNKQTGDLTITNVKITDIGLYKIKINGARGMSSKIFNVTCVIESSDGVKIVSVPERDSVILSSGLKKIGSDVQITWRFEGNIIAQTNGSKIVPYDVLSGSFKIRLNRYNGSLVITNVRSNSSGLYVLDIRKNSGGFTTHKRFRVTTIDAVKTLTGVEGISVTLESGIEIHKDDVITWRFEHEDSAIANISNGSFATSDGADGRFRARLELDDKTGSLTIRNIKMTHAGLYHLDITGNRRTIFKRFSLSVCSQEWLNDLKVVAVGVLMLIVGVFSGVSLMICCQNCKKCESICGVAGKRSDVI